MLVGNIGNYDCSFSSKGLGPIWATNINPQWGDFEFVQGDEIK
jgi:hypothetical protein